MEESFIYLFTELAKCNNILTSFIKQNEVIPYDRTKTFG